MLADVLIEPATTADAGPLLVVQRSAYVSEAQWYDARGSSLLETLDEVVAPSQRAGCSWRATATDWSGRSAGRRLTGCATSTGSRSPPTCRGTASAAGCWSPPSSRRTAEYTLFTGADSPHNIRLYERHGYVITHTVQADERWAFVHLTKVRPAG